MAALFVVSATVKAEDTAVSAGTGGSAPRLDVNDVSWLFPLPEDSDDVTRLISLGELKASDGSAIFSQQDFDRLLAIAESDASKIGSRRAGIPPRLKDLSVWKIAGVRIDPVAPGGSLEIQDAFGPVPQIRLVVQPVTKPAKVEDFAFHLIFTLVDKRVRESQSDVLGKAVPDEQAMQAAVDDLVRIKQACSDAGVSTDGLLDVHPCLERAGEKPELRAEFLDFLNRHLKPENFNTGAVMALVTNNPEPWFFVAVQRKKNGQLGAVPSPGLGPFPPSPTASAPTAQMLSFVDTPQVQPAPSPTNLNPVTRSLFIPSAERRGVSTAVLFTSASLDAPATIGFDQHGKPLTDPIFKNRNIPDFIANPEKTHFFAADCVSCHTESTLRARLRIPETSVAYALPAGVSGLNPERLPGAASDDPEDRIVKWNVHMFGWFRTHATITQRTANETAEVADFINRQMLGK